MADVVGVRFKRSGPVYFFDPRAMELDIDDWVVVETSHGLSLGRVVIAPRQVLDSELSEPLKPVVRKAEPEDREQMEQMAAKAEEALASCAEMAQRLGLPMKILSAEYNLDGSHLTLFFKAEKRVDFRALLKELTAALKTKVELRQVGARDVAKIVGGLGRCGRELCCAGHLARFEAISMRMAKEQGLPLNPEKISGVCGRLLCCLGYENEQYRRLRQRLPTAGEAVTTPFGKGKVVGGNPLKETVLVELESEAILEFPLCQVVAIPQGEEQANPPP